MGVLFPPASIIAYAVMEKEEVRREKDRERERKRGREREAISFK